MLIGPVIGRKRRGVAGAAEGRVAASDRQASSAMVSPNVNADWIVDALVDNGIPQVRPADFEDILLPSTGERLACPRVHPAWSVVREHATFAGIPNKCLVSAPSLAAELPAEVVVAELCRQHLGGDAWWVHWRRPTERGITALAGQSVEYSVEVARTLQRLAHRAQALVTPPGSSNRGGVWDVVGRSRDGAYVFLECKRADKGHDRIRPNQAAFLEAVRLELPTAWFGIVSWSDRGLVH